MSVSALGSSQQVAYTQYYSTPTVNNQSGSTGSSAPAGNAVTNFAQAISNALSQLSTGSTPTGSTTGSTATTSTTGTSGTSSTDNTQTPQQALQAFVQNLLAAIQSQVSGASSSSGSGHHHHHGGGGLGKVESGIQDIINQLTSGSSRPGTGASSTGSTTSGAVTATTGSGTGNSAVSALQSSFNNLLSADGISGSSATLTNFLQNLESNLQGSGTSGNVVKTTA